MASVETAVTQFSKISNWSPSSNVRKPIFSLTGILTIGYEDAFSVYDVRGNGLIKINDVFPLIRSLGHNPLEAAVWCYMNDLGLTGERDLLQTPFT